MIEYILVSGGCINETTLVEYLQRIDEKKAYKYKKHFIDDELKEYKVMAIDKGIEILSKLDIKPDYILGDFDSVDKDIYNAYVSKYTDVELARFKSEKDYTDTELGIRVALEKEADVITIFGATGTRLDHTLANIRILNIAMENNVFAQIIDEHNRIYLAKNSLTLYKDKMYGNYVSIIPYKDALNRITLKGFKYDIDNAIMLYDASVGISNEIISNEASITCENGIFIIIESKD